MTMTSRAPGRTSHGAPAKKPSVAVVVSWPSRSTLLPDEETSLRHLRHYLGEYDKFVIAPRSLDLSLLDFEVIRFDDRYFGSVRNHTALMLSPRFYESFRGYEFILTYHVDALVLSDQLREWCERGWDFIGAPNHGTAQHLSVPCNGGFALRRIEAFLAVLKSKRYAVDPEAYWAAFRSRKGPLEQILHWPRRYAKRLHVFNGVHREIRMMLDDPAPPLDDVFMVENATKYYPDFRIPSVREALRFAFDETPRAAFELNGCQLPFGAHAWFKHDRAFWAPYLLR